MTDIKQKFISLNLSNKFSSVNIVDGIQTTVLGKGVVHATPSSTLIDVLYVLKFLVSILSISQFTKHNSCKITIFLPIAFFRTYRLGG